MLRARLNVVFPIGLRMLADGVMIVMALAFALVVKLFAALAVDDAAPAGTHQFAAKLGLHGLLLALVAVAVFYAWGFYGRIRYQTSPQKMIRLAQGGTIAFALYGLGQSALGSDLGLGLDVLAMAWSVSMVLLFASRYWSMLWRTFTLAETGIARFAGVEDNAKRVLVVGGAGYIGSALLPKLLDKGYRVRLLDLLLFGEEPIRDAIGHPNLEILRADYRQVDRLVAAMKGVDAVVHLGGLVGDPACSIDEDLTTEVNLDFTRIIAEVAKGSGVKRFVFASSCSVYGASDEVLDESSRLNPVSLYARSKIASENVLFEMADSAFSLTMLRFGTIYGLSGRTRFDLVVNLLTAKALDDGKITVYGGDQWRPFVHVDDAALAVQMVLEAPVRKVRNEIFNVGSDEQNATLGDVGRIIERLVPDTEYVDSGPDGDRRNYRVDFSKIRNALGFEPAWTLELGVRQVIEAIRSGRVKDFRDPMYSNVRFLTEGTAPRYTRVRKDWARQRIAGDVSRSSKSQADARTRVTDQEASADGNRPAGARVDKKVEKAGA